MIIVLLGIGFGYAYNSGASPDVMGHSAEELEVEVNIGGSMVSLQDAIDNGDLGGGGEGFGGFYTKGPSSAGKPCQAKNAMTSPPSCGCPSGYVSVGVGSIGVPAGNTFSVYQCILE